MSTKVISSRYHLPEVEGRLSKQTELQIDQGQKKAVPLHITIIKAFQNLSGFSVDETTLISVFPAFDEYGYGLSAPILLQRASPLV